MYLVESDFLCFSVPSVESKQTWPGLACRWMITFHVNVFFFFFSVQNGMVRKWRDVGKLNIDMVVWFLTK